MNLIGEFTRRLSEMAPFFNSVERKGEPMRYGLTTFITLVLVMAFLGCSSMTTTQKGAAIGGLGGAATGGLVGSAVHHPVAGALIGGALIGNQLQGQEEVQQQQQEEINRQSTELSRQREELQRLKQQREY